MASSSSSSDIYATWIQGVFQSYESYTEESLTRDIPTALEDYKYVGFDLAKLATLLKDRPVQDLSKMLTVFHARGTKISKMKKSMDSSKVSAFNTLMAGVKDNSTQDKSALTLSRLSLALPGYSIFVASKMSEMNQLATRALTRDFALFSVNSVPGVLQYKETMNRKEIWEMYLLANAYLTTVVKAGTSKSEAMDKACSFGLLTFNGSRDSEGFTVKAINALNQIRVTQAVVQSRYEAMGFEMPSVSLPAATKVLSDPYKKELIVH